MKNRLVLLASLLAPAAAIAQPTPSAPVAPDASQTTQAPAAPTTTVQPTVVVNPQAPAPAPVVNPPIEPAPTPVVVTTAPQYEEVYDSYNAPVFTTGALVFAATYGASVITAAASDDERGNNRLYVPLVGPWLALNDRGSCDIEKSSCDHETTAKVLLVADGVFQAAGVIAMIDGIFQPSSHRVVTRTAKVDTKVRVRPSFAGASAGLTVGGHW